jgi:Concanavalin A-like lectin/glucanases superfamily
MNSLPSFTGGSSAILEVMISLTAVVVLYVVLGSFEVLSSYFARLAGNRTELLPITYTSDMPYMFEQNPNINGSKTLELSNNERSGIEFSYTFFIYVNPSNFKAGQAGLLHIFHKGYATQFPLLGPGVYMDNATNTLRVIMNSYDTWFNVASVDNIPVNKWVFVTISCKGSELLVYINGNIKTRIVFATTPPYQNYQNLYVFSNNQTTLTGSNIPSMQALITQGNNIIADMQGMKVNGVMKGMLSRLYYFNYALSYSEINSLMNQGPSTTIANAEQGMTTPYLRDDWWTAKFTT